MKKILFFLLLIGVFFIGSVTANALNGEIDYVKFYYINNNEIENQFTNWRFLDYYDTVGSDLADVISPSFYNDKFGVMTNLVDDYYVAPNRFNIRFYLDDNTFTCGDNQATITFRLKAFILDTQGGRIDPNFNAYNYWENAEFWITNDNEHDETYKCTAIADTNSNITVTCPYINQNYNYLHFHTYSEPFKELSTDSGKYTIINYTLSVQKSITYECLDHPFLTLSSSVNGSNATVTVSGSSSDVVGYYYYLPTVDAQENYSTSNTYTYNNLSNGTYTVYVNAVYSDGSQGSMTQTTFTITDSPLPTASFILRQTGTTEENASIFVEASSSTAVDGSISKYYYRLDDGQWYTTTNPNYTFVNVGFGVHYIYMKVEDANGNLSTTVSKYINVLTPYEEEKGFWENITSFFTNFWDNLTGFFSGAFEQFQMKFNIWFMDFLKATARIFLPSQESLESWLSRMNTLIDNQMGFLAYPFTWTLNFLERFVALEDTGSYVISWGNIAVPNFNQNIINAGSYDLATLLENPTIKNAHDIYIMAVNAILLLMFMNTCWNKFNEVFGGSVVTYDTDIIADNATTDDHGNLHTSSFVSNRRITRRRRL